MELSQGNESFMLCEVQNANGPRILTAHEESYLGRFEIGDEVLDVRKFEPTSLGSSMFELSDKVFPVFVEDIRKRNMHNFLHEVDTSRRSARVAGGPSSSSDAPSQRKLFSLSSEGKQALLKLVAADTEIRDRRNLRQLGQ